MFARSKPDDVLQNPRWLTFSRRNFQLPGTHYIFTDDDTSELLTDCEGLRMLSTSLGLEVFLKEIFFNVHSSLTGFLFFVLQKIKFPSFSFFLLYQVIKWVISRERLNLRSRTKWLHLFGRWWWQQEGEWYGSEDCRIKESPRISFFWSLRWFGTPTWTSPLIRAMGYCRYRKYSGRPWEETQGVQELQRVKRFKIPHGRQQ